MEFLVNTYGTQGIAQTVRCPCKPIIFSIGQFDGSTEVELNGW